MKDAATNAIDFDLDDLALATDVVRRHVPPTPQYE